MGLVLDTDTTAPDSAARQSSRTGPRLLDILDLEPCDEGGPDTFTGRSEPQPWGRVFGGQALAQSLVAAQRTVAAERRVHSLHGYFLRPGDPAEPITFTVDRLRDGSSFSSRRVQAFQSGQVILSMIASFQLPADGIDHAVPMPDVPPPTALLSLPHRIDGPGTRRLRDWLLTRPVDLRHVQAPIHVEAARRESMQAVWMRAVDPLPADPALHAAVLAFASDYTILEPALRAHGLAWSQPGIRVASLDHALWWHRPARSDEWLLYVLDSPSASGARALCTGRIYTADGVLVASVAQEGMVRLACPSGG
jgi:acyl-CoA thioesterase-2